MLHTYLNFQNGTQRTVLSDWSKIGYLNGDRFTSSK